MPSEMQGTRARFHCPICPPDGLSLRKTQLAAAELSTAEGGLGWNLLPTSLDCTDHGMPTHPQAEDAHRVLHKETGTPSPQSQRVPKS